MSNSPDNKKNNSDISNVNNLNSLETPGANSKYLYDPKSKFYILYFKY